MAIGDCVDSSSLLSSSSSQRRMLPQLLPMILKKDKMIGVSSIVLGG